jgi:hypothetical protein
VFAEVYVQELRIGTTLTLDVEYPILFDVTALGSSKLIDCTTLVQIPAQEFYEDPICAIVVEPNYIVPEPDVYLTHDGNFTLVFTSPVVFTTPSYLVNEGTTSLFYVNWTDSLSGNFTLESTLSVEGTALVYTATEFTLRKNGARYRPPISLAASLVGPATYETTVQVDVVNQVSDMTGFLISSLNLPYRTTTEARLFQLVNSDADDFIAGIQLKSTGTVRIFFEGENLTQDGCPTNYNLIGCYSFSILGTPTNLNNMVMWLNVRSDDVSIQFYTYYPVVSEYFTDDEDPIEEFTVRVYTTVPDSGSSSTFFLIFIAFILPVSLGSCCCATLASPFYIFRDIVRDWYMTIRRLFCREISCVQCIDHCCELEDGKGKVVPEPPHASVKPETGMTREASTGPNRSRETDDKQPLLSAQWRAAPKRRFGT